MSTAAGVRRATDADLPTLTQVLVRAFMDDPVAGWSCPPERLRAAVLEGFHGTRLRQLIAHSEVWTTRERSSVALWAPPSRWRTSWREDVAIARRSTRPQLVPRLPLVAVGLLGVERAHPPEPPHWYLATLGTDPVAQGQGLGSAVLGPVLEQCDVDGIGAYLESSKEDHLKRYGTPAYLESSKERNISFYERFGFRVIGEHRLPRGPKVWQMWRDPPGAPLTRF